MSEIVFAQYLENGWTELKQIYMHIIIDKIYVGIVNGHFSQICNGVTALYWCQKLVFAQYLDNELTEFNQTFVYTLPLTWSIHHQFFKLNISLSSNSAMAGQYSYPLTILVFAGNKNNHYV